MEDQNKNQAEEQQTEEVKAEVVEKKEEKKYDENNLKFSIILAVVIASLMVLHMILGIIHGNLFWFIANTLFTICAVAVLIVSALFFIRFTSKNLKNDIPSFVVSLVALVLSASCTLWWSIDMITNLIGFIKDITN